MTSGDIAAMTPQEAAEALDRLGDNPYAPLALRQALQQQVAAGESKSLHSQPQSSLSPVQGEFLLLPPAAYMPEAAHDLLVQARQLEELRPSLWRREEAQALRIQWIRLIQGNRHWEREAWFEEVRKEIFDQILPRLAA